MRGDSGIEPDGCKQHFKQLSRYSEFRLTCAAKNLSLVSRQRREGIPLKFIPIYERRPLPLESNQRSCEVIDSTDQECEPAQGNVPLSSRTTGWKQVSVQSCYVTMNNSNIIKIGGILSSIPAESLPSILADQDYRND